jgi:hypothetical protein
VFTRWFCNEESSLWTLGKAHCFPSLAGRYCRYSSSEREVEIDSPSLHAVASFSAAALSAAEVSLGDQTTNSHVNSGFTVRHHPLQSC